mgnify:CR=1 FL=1
MIKATVVRRSRWIGSGEGLGRIFDRLRADVKKEASDGGRNPLFREREELRTFLNGIYLLSVFYELEGLEAARGGNPERVAEKTAESRVYYKFIEDEHGRRNPSGKKAVAELIGEDPRDMNIDLIRSLLTDAFQTELSLLAPRFLDENG